MSDRTEELTSMFKACNMNELEERLQTSVKDALARVIEEVKKEEQEEKIETSEVATGVDHESVEASSNRNDTTGNPQGAEGTSKDKGDIQSVIGKTPDDLRGIGKPYGKKLQDAGFKSVSDIVLKYISLERNEDDFISWLTNLGIQKNCAENCYKDLKERCDKFL